ncbi:hypothetical protein B7494_g224 [Chlorociboria aeruginascens]|nr:hypothetical protein B7494_g224 [Chlorociboria aeruginascens]
MAPSDLEQLIEFGFARDMAAMAVEKTGNLQGALEWLETNQDKTIEQINAENAITAAASAETDASIEPPALKEGEIAKSMVCDECGKKFRSMAQAEFHAEKTEHTNFSESTEEIAPLTEEEKKQRLDELRAKMADKKAKQALLDKEEQKKNEKIRMKSTREIQDAKEDLAKKEQIKAAAAKRQEKLNDIAAKNKVKEKIAADKEQRRLKAEQQKAERGGQALPPKPSMAAQAPAPVPKTEIVHTEARLRLRIRGDFILKTFPAETTLFEVAEAVKAENINPVESLTLTYPKKTFSGPVDFGKTLKEAGLVPSAVLIVQ